MPKRNPSPLIPSPDTATNLFDGDKTTDQRLGKIFKLDRERQTLTIHIREVVTHKLSEFPPYESAPTDRNDEPGFAWFWEKRMQTLMSNIRENAARQLGIDWALVEWKLRIEQSCTHEKQVGRDEFGKRIAGLLVNGQLARNISKRRATIDPTMYAAWLCDKQLTPPMFFAINPPIKAEDCIHGITYPAKGLQYQLLDTCAICLNLPKLQDEETTTTKPVHDDVIKMRQFYGINAAPGLWEQTFSPWVAEPHQVSTAFPELKWQSEYAATDARIADHFMGFKQTKDDKRRLYEWFPKTLEAWRELKSLQTYVRPDGWFDYARRTELLPSMWPHGRNGKENINVSEIAVEAVWCESHVPAHEVPPHPKPDVDGYYRTIAKLHEAKHETQYVYAFDLNNLVWKCYAAEARRCVDRISDQPPFKLSNTFFPFLLRWHKAVWETSIYRSQFKKRLVDSVVRCEAPLILMKKEPRSQADIERMLVSGATNSDGAFFRMNGEQEKRTYGCGEGKRVNTAGMPLDAEFNVRDPYEDKNIKGDRYAEDQRGDHSSGDYRADAIFKNRRPWNWSALTYKVCARARCQKLFIGYGNKEHCSVNCQKRHPEEHERFMRKLVKELRCSNLAVELISKTIREWRINKWRINKWLRRR